MRSIKTSTLSHPVMEVISMTGTAFVILYGLYAIIVRKTMTPGDFFSFTVALVFFYRPLKDLNGINNIVQDGIAAAKRIFEVLDTEPEIRSKEGAVVLSRDFRTIELKDLHFQYDETPVLKGIDLSVNAGESIAIVGRSGGGKTTLVNLLPRFYDVTRGAILIDGTDIRNATLESLRSCTAIVTQQTILFNDTIRNNIAYGHTEKSFDHVVRAATIAAWDTKELSGSLSFGYYSATESRTLTRSVTVRNYSSTSRTLSNAPSFRYADDAASGAVTVKAPGSISVRANSSATFNVQLRVDAFKLPAWTLNGGSQGGNGPLLQSVEFDGYVTLSDGSGSISLPWHVLPQKSSDVYPSSTTVAAGGSVTLQNKGAAPGNVSVFSLTGTSGRVPVSTYPDAGDNFAVIDLKAVGVSGGQQSAFRETCDRHGWRKCRTQSRQ